MHIKIVHIHKKKQYYINNSEKKLPAIQRTIAGKSDSQCSGSWPVFPSRMLWILQNPKQVDVTLLEIQQFV